MSDLFSVLPSLSAGSFFSLAASCYYLPRNRKNFSEKKYLLPSLSPYTEQEEFSNFYLAWNEEKFFIHVEVNTTYKKCFDPDFHKGDAIFLFFDTRNSKSQGFVTKFSHQFVFFPEKVHGYYGREITRFRTEDIHPHCDQKDLVITPEVSFSSYTLKIEIPSHCLYGYDPDSFKQIGFAYQVHRFEKGPQEFPLSSQEFKLALYPSLWATLDLKRE